MINQAIDKLLKLEALEQCISLFFYKLSVIFPTIQNWFPCRSIKLRVTEITNR